MRSFLLACLALLALVVPASAQPVAVSLNGYRVPLDQPPIINGGRVLVPLRGIFEKMGADVVWVPEYRQVRCTRGSTTIQLSLNNRSAIINGQNVYLDAPPREQYGRTFVPLRFISQALGAEVRWDHASRTVVITNGQAQQPMAAGPTLRVVSPSENQNVPSTFTFVATTQPGLRVDFSVEVSPAPVPGYVVAEPRVTRVSVTADATGQVVIPVRIHGPEGALVHLTACAQDGQGHLSPVEQVTAIHFVAGPRQQMMPRPY